LKVVFGCRRSIRELRGWEVVDVERREIEGKRRKGGYLSSVGSKR
jgi:hypothetical protein